MAFAPKWSCMCVCLCVFQLDLWYSWPPVQRCTPGRPYTVPPPPPSLRLSKNGSLKSHTSCTSAHAIRDKFRLSLFPIFCTVCGFSLCVYLCLTTFHLSLANLCTFCFCVFNFHLRAITEILIALNEFVSSFVKLQLYKEFFPLDIIQSNIPSKC